MGWLLTIWLSLPLAESDVEVRMWFSQKSYCTFAEEKFLENPIRHVASDGRAAEAKVRAHHCRKLHADEVHLVPEHMRK